jgi:ubiquinone/menaquinone biosynthesis C-methylase UbiE
MGAVAVGIDVSAEQVAYARRYALRHGAQNASFVEGTVEDLSRFEDATFDLAVSIHVFGYVEYVESAIAEVVRVLKPGGVLAIAVPHPFDITHNDDPPYEIARSYFDGDVDWDWTFERATGRFREYRHTVADWFAMLVEAGLVIDRLLEPDQSGITGDDRSGFDTDRARLIPYVLILKARKP